MNFFEHLIRMEAARRGAPIHDPHHHKCPNCSNIWGHDSADIDMAPDPQAANEAAHTCTKCGSSEDGCWNWYRGPLPENPTHT